MPNFLEDYLTGNELAEALAINPRTLRRWTDMGAGPPMTMLGKRRLYRRQSVESWLVAREARRPQGRARS